MEGERVIFADEGVRLGSHSSSLPVGPSGCYAAEWPARSLPSGGNGAWLQQPHPRRRYPVASPRKPRPQTTKAHVEEVHHLILTAGAVSSAPWTPPCIRRRNIESRRQSLSPELEIFRAGGEDTAARNPAGAHRDATAFVAFLWERNWLAASAIAAIFATAFVVARRNRSLHRHPDRWPVTRLLPVSCRSDYDSLSEGVG